MFGTGLAAPADESSGVPTGNSTITGSGASATTGLTGTDKVSPACSAPEAIASDRAVWAASGI
jgi:hypothetical protein